MGIGIIVIYKSATLYLALQSSQIGRRKFIKSVPPVPLPPALCSSPFFGAAVVVTAEVVVDTGAVS